MKKVLIAMDYDPTSLKVAESGCALAIAMNAEIILLHVISNPMAYYTATPEMIPHQINNIEELKEAAQKFLNKTKHDLGYKAIQTLIKDGDTAEQILESAKKSNANLIVIGTHSRKWLESILMGSVTEKVLKETKLPLFIVPTKKHD